MIPGGCEAEPEDGQSAEREPTLEPLTSRYLMNDRSLGHVFCRPYVQSGKHAGLDVPQM